MGIESHAQRLQAPESAGNRTHRNLHYTQFSRACVRNGNLEKPVKSYKAGANREIYIYLRKSQEGFSLGVENRKILKIFDPTRTGYDPSEIPQIEQDRWELRAMALRYKSLKKQRTRRIGTCTIHSFQGRVHGTGSCKNRSDCTKPVPIEKVLLTL